MRVLLVTPAPPGSYAGNRVTALRWAAILRGLGHEVDVVEEYTDQRADLLIALHASKSADSVAGFRARRPGAPVVVALTGTDLYPDLATTGVSVRGLELADRLVVLQTLGTLQLPAYLRSKARVIHQSAASPADPHAARPAEPVVTLLAHLRPVKDPLLAAAAVRLMPPASAVRVRHAGAGLDAQLVDAARTETAANPRYDWLGELAQPDALALLGASWLLLVTSKHEGGANVVSEALAAGVPVLSTRIAGSIGLLGADYPGYFPVGDAAALAQLLWRAASNADGLYDELSARCRRLALLVDPARERAAWQNLLVELTGEPVETIG